MARRRSQEALSCPTCGIDYRDFTTGLSFADVRQLLWTGDDRPENWRYKRRNTVLGKWRQIKAEFWNQHLDTCDGQSDRIDVNIEGLRFKTDGQMEFEEY